MLIQYNPDFPPLYLKTAESLWSHGDQNPARQMLKKMRSQCHLHGDAFEKAAALIERLDHSPPNPTAR